MGRGASRQMRVSSRVLTDRHILKPRLARDRVETTDLPRCIPKRCRVPACLLHPLLVSFAVLTLDLLAPRLPHRCCPSPPHRPVPAHPVAVCLGIQSPRLPIRLESLKRWRLRTVRCRVPPRLWGLRFRLRLLATRRAVHRPLDHLLELCHLSILVALSSSSRCISGHRLWRSCGRR